VSDSAERPDIILRASSSQNKSARRRSVARVAQTWAPDRRWYHPVLVIGVTYLLGWVPTFGKFPPLYMSIWIVPSLILALVMARVNWPEERYGHAPKDWMGCLYVLTAILSTGWVVYAGLHSPVDRHALTFLFGAGVLLGVWYAVMCTRVPEWQAKAEQRESNIKDRLFLTEWSEILTKTGAAGCVIKEKQDVAGGYTIKVSPNPLKPNEFLQLKGSETRLAMNASLVLSRRGVKLRTSDIKVEEDEEEAHILLIHVTTARLLSKSLDYQLPETSPSITSARSVGQYQTGDPLTLTMHDSHIGVIGATDSGKTVFTNSLIGRTSECYDALVWIGATSKLIPLIYPWLRPWFDGRMNRPVLDYVAGESIDELLRMLALAYKEMRRRNSSLSNKSHISYSASEPAIKVYIDEASDSLTRPNKVRTFDGRWMNATQLVDKIAEAGRSAGVSAALITQSAIFEKLGNNGPSIKRNLTCRIALRTMTVHDGTTTLVGMKNVNTTTLRNNTMLVQPSKEEPRALAAKSAFLEGDAVHAVAIHNGQSKPELRADVVEYLGDDYRRRWDRARLPELVAACEADGYVWPVPQQQAPEPRGSEPRQDTPTASSDSSLRDGRTYSGLTTVDPFDEIMRAEFSPADFSFENTGEDVKPTISEGTPDLSNEVDRLRDIAGRMRGERPATPHSDIPDPLGAVLRALESPRAPTDFVSTRQLALVLGRVSTQAGQVELNGAAQELGRQLSIQVPGLRSQQVWVPTAGKLVRGYRVARLRAAADAIRQSVELPPDSEDA
jgi:hypothetical protein